MTDHEAAIAAFKARIAAAQSEAIQIRAEIAALKAGDTFAAYWAQSASAKLCADIEAGNFVTIHA